jgi:type II secretory ATPase GspE/PulE/Tfp pilus assembly ATPase PilB-like protein
MSESVSRLASRGATHDQITEAAMAAGMRTLWDDGLDKVAAGLTTVEELARVVV